MIVVESLDADKLIFKLLYIVSYVTRDVSFVGNNNNKS